MGDSGTDETLAATATASSGNDATLPADSASVARPSGALPVVDPSLYEHGTEIARGGMGRIHAAQDRRVGRPVAVKELLAANPAAVARFEREALITARLQHPAIVPVYEVGRWPSGELFFAMKHVAGRSLDKAVSELPTLAERLALLHHVIAVAEALAYAHSRRIIHRDLKPGNVLVGEFGETVVIDWGLAKDLASTDDDRGDATPGSQDGALTVVGAAMGTPAYMPPEQALGEPVDERADVYAIGAIVYHVLTGKMPYTAPTAELVLLEVGMRPPRAVREVEPGVPPELATIVETAMARAPADRYPTARELAEELRRYETGQLVQAHSYSVGALLRRFVRRHRAALIVAAIMLVASGIAAGVAVSRIVQARADAEAERETADHRRVEAEGAKAEAERQRVAADAARHEADTERDRAEARRVQANAAAEQLVDAWVRAEHLEDLRKCIPPSVELAALVELDIGEHGALEHAGVMAPDWKALVEKYPDRATLTAIAVASKCVGDAAKTWKFPSAMMPGLFGLSIGRAHGGDVVVHFARADKAMIQAKVRETFAHELKSCYVQLLATKPTARGRLDTAFTITPEGTTTVDKVESFDPTFTACVREGMTHWRFPRPGEPLKVVYPFELHPSDD